MPNGAGDSYEEVHLEQQAQINVDGRFGARGGGGGGGCVSSNGAEHKFDRKQQRR